MMTTKVEVREDESIESALRRFRQLVRRELGRPWYKRRYGYYEKPSELRRKRKKMARLRKQVTWRGPDPGNLLLRIGLTELHARTGPKNAAGK